MTIREETKADFPEIAALTQAAFGGNYEATLIEKLRAAHLVIVSLVAVEQGSVVGHILFSKLDVEVDGRLVRAAALAPLAVQPERQRRGFGSKLVEAGLQVLRDRGYEAVIVLGHPDYYPRFGFSPSLTASLVALFSGRAFMGLELMSGSLSGSRGSVEYPEAFGV
jgi:putative acetyltransferase